jgi:RNA polymerase sigma factor (sigma-70 family)
VPGKRPENWIREVRRITAAMGSAAGSDSQLLLRFTAEHDQAAFAALVRRHGPMVLAVCRRVLRDSHDAEDAFQATFLVLAKKARSLGKPDLHFNWLYGVAYRTAMEAKMNRAKRRAKERHGVPAQAVGPSDEVVWAEVREVLDDEISRLPTRYRVPFVLCHLKAKPTSKLRSFWDARRGPS